MDNYDVLKLREQVNFIKKLQNDLVVLASYNSHSEALNEFAERLNYTTQTLNTLANSYAH